MTQAGEAGASLAVGSQAGACERGERRGRTTSRRLNHPAAELVLFQSYNSRFDPRLLAWARLVHERIFASMPLIWARKGTWIEAWNGSRRIAFAPHRNGAAIYFQGPESVEFYRDRGGRCKTGKVSIQVPVGGEFESALLRSIVADHLGLPTPAESFGDDCPGWQDV